MPAPRRSFLKSAASLLPAALFGDLEAQSPAIPQASALHVVGAGQDRLGRPHSLGFSSLAFKITSSDTGGNLFVIEHTNLRPGTGPALHLHNSQEEWFYAMEGEAVLQVGDERVHIHSGESVLAPRGVPHTFSAAGAPARLLIAFTPAGKMEQYFIDAAAHPQLAATAEFMNRYEMQWIGPSPFWKS
ncbi:MAG TPA: cupin domain-containing protein [Terracidiphilus sp.]|nr:cupin domain-containing protein [Terracidiphilus sp.]